MVALRPIERAAVAGWPALETESIGGWLARASSGGSVRANSVAALDWEGGDIDTALDRIVAFYRVRGLVPRFTISDVSEPEGLDGALAERGWVRSGDHLTMARAVEPQPRERATDADVVVEAMDGPTDGWFDVYLAGVSDDRRAAAPRLVEGVPQPRTFFAARRDGHVIGSALSVYDGDLASVQCMATLASARRTGAARALLGAIEMAAIARGSQGLYLQTDAVNTAAVALYQGVGYRIVGRYHTRSLGLR